MKKYLLPLLLLISQYSFSTNYSVSTVNELHNTVDIVIPGDTIIMTNGIWTDAEITFDPDGAPNNPIVLKAETPGEVIITGDVRLRIGGDYLLVTGLKFENCIATEGNLISFRKSSTEFATYSRLTESVITNCNPPSNDTNYKWVGIYGNNNEVDHCYIANKTHVGAALVVWTDETEGNHHVHHNFFGPSPEGDGNGYETIRVGTSTYAEHAGYNLIEHNYFHQRDGEIEIISGKSSYSIYRYNIFKDCKGGLTLRHGTNCLVEGNIFFGESKSGSYGIRIIDRDHLIINNYLADLDYGGSGVRHPISIMNADLNPEPTGYQHAIKDTIAYNTIVDCTKAIMIGAEDRPVAPDGCVLINNVVTINNSPPVVHNNPPTDIYYAGNFFHRVDDEVTVPESGFVDIDPQLAIPSGDSIFRPDASSPIVGAAVTGIVQETFDFELHSRPNTPASGADEISSSPPIDRGIFGPTWLVDGPLPVEMLHLSVKQESECAMISWSVTNEEAIDRYIIMRSTDGINFSPIGHQTARNENDIIQNYSFIDCNIQQLNIAHVFYLLHILNFDGTIQKSKLVVLNIKSDHKKIKLLTQQNNNQFGLYYPSNNQQENESASFTIYSISGTTILKEQIINEGEKIFLGEYWPPNQYLIYCKYASGNHDIFKWVKW